MDRPDYVFSADGSAFDSPYITRTQPKEELDNGTLSVAQELARS